VVVNEILHGSDYSAAEGLLSKLSMSKYSAGIQPKVRPDPMAEIALPTVVEAGIALMRAGRWNAATNLLQAVTPTTRAERLTVAAVLAEVAVDQDFAQRTAHADGALAVLESALSEAPDAVAGWDHDFLRLRKDYGAALFTGEEPKSGSDGRDPAESEALAKRADQLRESAPDDARSGHAAFYAGLIADNVLEIPEDAFASYTAALELGERSGDDLLASLALRHLGDHAHTAGNLALARTQWERSTELRQKVGHLLGALAQQALLAVLVKDEGNPTGSVTLATEVNRWARQAGLPWLEAQTSGLMQTVG
jgi:tetratricopeptide (TPR) repeat protein